MTRWEYWCALAARISTLRDVANEIGQNGWEAFAVCWTPSDDWVMWFKRPLQDIITPTSTPAFAEAECREMAEVATSIYSGTAIYPRMMRL